MMWRQRSRDEFRRGRGRRRAGGRMETAMGREGDGDRVISGQKRILLHRFLTPKIFVASFSHGRDFQVPVLLAGCRCRKPTKET